MLQTIGCIILAHDSHVHNCYAFIRFPLCGKPSVCKDAGASEMVYK